eukprot:COSAG01_NODE_39491_length_475_cov_12.986702_2_plen_71_part_00
MSHTERAREWFGDDEEAVGEAAAEAEEGAERRVRAEFADGDVLYYEGEKGAERCVRAECADGTVLLETDY